MKQSANAQVQLPGVPLVGPRSDAGFFILPIGDSIRSAVISENPLRRFSIVGLFTGADGAASGGDGYAVRRVLHSAFLALIFLLCFVGPLFVAAHFGGFFKSRQAPQPGVDELFPQSIAAGQAGGVQFASSPVLEPQTGTDFLAVSWFKFKKLPAPGERVLLLSKSEPGSKLETGYALLLVGDVEGPRPMVFLGSPSGGAWYRFTELKAVAQQWVMFALSIREGRFLGLHVATVVDPGRSDIRLLGGYDLESLPALGNERSLVIAPGGMTRFSGRIGPVGIFQRKGLGEDLRQLLKDLSRRPDDSSDLFARDEVALWWEGGTEDLSQHQHRWLGGGSAKGKESSGG